MEDLKLRLKTYPLGIHKIPLFGRRKRVVIIQCILLMKIFTQKVWFGKGQVKFGQTS